MTNVLDGMNKGELQLYDVLKGKECDSFRLIPNIILERHADGTNQIDLVAITQKGILVFEMKDYSGWIFGNEDNAEWTQMLNKKRFGSKKNRFRNPVKQNENHIKTIRHLLAKHNFHPPIINIVVFGSKATLKDVTSSVAVVTVDEVIDLIEKYPDINYDSETIKAIETLFLNNMKVGKEALEGHLHYVKALSEINNRERPVATPHVDHEVEGEGTIVFDEVNKEGRSRLFWLKLLLALVIFGSAFFYPVAICGVIYLLPTRKLIDEYGYVLYLFITPIVVFLMVSSMSFFYDDNAMDASLINYEVNVERVVIESTQRETVYTVAMTIPPDTTAPATTIIEKTRTEGESISTTALTETTVIAEAITTSPPLTLNLSQDEIDLGSSKDDVIRLLGEPDVSNHYRYVYKQSSISFNQNWEVSGWTNSLKQLDQVLKSPMGGLFDLGSSREEVQKALGSPTTIVASNPYKWDYKSSYVMFSGDWKVIEWANNMDQLTLGLHRPLEGVFELGSTREVVQKALGSPTTIVASNPYKWNYKSSYVLFNSDWKVIEWANRFDQLALGLKTPVGGMIDVGSTKEAVISALGSPTSVVSNDHYKWYYSSSYVIFDQEWKVLTWKNLNNRLSHVLP